MGVKKSNYSVWNFEKKKPPELLTPPPLGNKIFFFSVVFEKKAKGFGRGFFLAQGFFRGGLIFQTSGGLGG